MDDIITNMRIGLEKAHVKGVPEYIKNLQAISDSLEDFRLEGKAALMFARAGCSVTIRKRAEPPDLALKFNNEQFYAEVKHFREKEQDRIDAAKMSELVDEDELVPYGDTVALEGKHAWEQVYHVAKKKIKQYEECAPNILVVESSSTSIEDTEILTAIDTINEDVHYGKCPGFAKLNGILLAVDWNNISHQWRNAYFFRTSNPVVPLSRQLSSLLDKICFG
ncbi:MAG: hypothetical protein JW732_08620 [Dehalococcoidia bacterium]|nr:hypothetical protein [Dehalococcoidia bacterium]